MERKFKPKTGKEKGFQIAGAVCAILSIPHAIMMILPFAIIVNLIFFLFYHTYYILTYTE